MLFRSLGVRSVVTVHSGSHFPAAFMELADMVGTQERSAGYLPSPHPGKGWNVTPETVPVAVRRVAAPMQPLVHLVPVTGALR